MYKKPYRLLFSYFNVSAMWMNKAKYANYLNILEGNYLSKTVFFLTNKHFYRKKKDWIRNVVNVSNDKV